MRFYQTADMVRLTGLTKSQLREWCSVRNLIPADILPNGPGRHALFSWQSALALRLLKCIHEEWAGEVAGWAEPIRTFRTAIERTAFPSLWGAVVRFDQDRRPTVYRPTSAIIDAPALILPLDPHLMVLASSLAIPPPDQLNLFPAMALAK
jgi:hypothetical protein